MVESVQMWVKHLFTYHCVMIGGLLTQHWKLQLLLKVNNLQTLCQCKSPFKNVVQRLVLIYNYNKK